MYGKKIKQIPKATKRAPGCTRHCPGCDECRARRRPVIIARDWNTKEIVMSDLTEQERAEVQAITDDYRDQAELPLPGDESDV